MNVVALETAVAKLAEAISRQAELPTLDIPSCSELLRAAGDFLKTAKPVRLQTYTIAEPTLLSIYLVPGLVGATVSLVVAYADEGTSFVVPPLNWTWNSALGKLTLLNGYLFPSGGTVDLYYNA